MNWIKNMNDALDYIEENIENDISSEQVAKIAFSSKYHFLKMFYAISGITLNEYIRQRKLSLAAKDVTSTNMKIIDIAFKYGYETPEAFSKAFKKIHGLSPSKARKTEENLKAIPPLSFQITVKGEKRMDYKIVDKKGFKVVGFSKRVTKKNDENFKIIPKFWEDINKSGTCKKMFNNAGKLGIMGICLNYDMEQESFDYMVAIEGTEIEGLKDYQSAEIPDCTWAVFECIGPIPEAMHKVWHKIFAEWFPATKYEHANAPELEIYLPGNSDAKDYKCEIWIPIIKNSTFTGEK